MAHRDLKQIKKIIVHCSDSDFGNSMVINNWHRQRGFDCIGYHFVIKNGFEYAGAPYNPEQDGQIETGRMLQTIGAHVKGHNFDSIGICLIGKHLFSAKQLYEALPNQLLNLCVGFNLKFMDVYGHRDFDQNKTCPNIETQFIRSLVYFGKRPIA